MSTRLRLRPVIERLVALLAVFACLTTACVGVARTSWHHGNSPFRAVFKVTQGPTHREAGVAVTVPVCGLAGKDYRDLYAFDENGNQLKVFLVGPGARNTVLALVDGNRAFKEVYVYFGSGGRAPVLSEGFCPGLTVDVRTLPKGEAGNWDDVRRLLADSSRLGMVFVDKIEQAFNPVDATGSCILVFDGYLNVPKGGTYTYMIVTDDAGYFLIDDELVLSRNGRHYARDAARGECRTEVKLTAGLHKVRFVLVDFGGDLMAVLGRWISGREKYVLPPDAYVQSGRTRLMEVEARYRDAPLPVFRYEALSYMSYNGAQFTEMGFHAVNGEESLWRFEDGASHKGKQCVRVIPGLQSMGVACTQGRVTAQGLVQISEMPPKQHQMADQTAFRHYSELMLRQNLEKMDPTTLRGYVTFLSYLPMNPDLVPVCDAIAANRDASTVMRLEALLDLARAASPGDPDKARKAYEVLLDREEGALWLQHAREAAEFGMFCLRDFDWTEKVVDRIDKRMDRDNKLPEELRLDLALQQGREEEAREFLDDLLAGRELGQTQRYAAVQGNALKERFYDLLNAGFIIEAWDVLREWSDISPIDRTTGALALARARLWRTFGWLDGALGELDGAILLDPLLPNLPDVELERAKTIAAAGDTERANKLFLGIVNEYPNHPAADEAKGLLR